MSCSHLRVELRSPKRSLLDGGYGFDLTKYCSSCWSRFGRILKRGARCALCGRRVCKGCRHFVAAKEWICILCYKKRYAPEDSWHDDANVKRFKGSQGKSGTYLLRLTDWSAHGVLEVHKVNHQQTGRIHSFSNEAFETGHPSKGKLHRKNLGQRPNFQSSLLKPCYNYPLVQRDIQLKNWTALTDTMSVRQQESNLKYTSVNLKQKRRELREHRTLCYGKARQLMMDGSINECLSRKGHRGSSKREQSSASTHDCDNSLSIRRAAKSGDGTNSSAKPWWQKESRRSRRNSANSAAVLLNRGERFCSVRGTRIFGRRKSYRACPTLKGDAVVNRSLSLPCELSQDESHHDYEFWSSGFVQSRVRKLEEELTSKCDDSRFSYSCDYEVQSLCSLRLDKILPDGDDYRIAYLSSTSQESSLDYADDNYCSVLGMGTLDVKLDKRCPITGNEDWDLSFSSEENSASSDDDDDEFFYRKYTNANNDFSIPNANCCSKGGCILNERDNGADQHASVQGKRDSNFWGNGDAVDRKSIAQRIHEDVDRIFYDVMHYDFDIPQPIQKKRNKAFVFECASCSSSDEKESNLFEQKEIPKRNKSIDCDSLYDFGDLQSLDFSQKEGTGDNVAEFSDGSTEKRPNDSENEIPVKNIPESRFLDYDKEVNKYEIPSLNELSNYDFLNIAPVDETQNHDSNEKSLSNFSPNFSPDDDCQQLNNLLDESFDERQNSFARKCLFLEDEDDKSHDQIENLSFNNFSQCPTEKFMPIPNSETKISETNANASDVTECFNDLDKSNSVSKIIPHGNIPSCVENSLLPGNNLFSKNNSISEFYIPGDDAGNMNKCENFDPAYKNLKFYGKLRNSSMRSKHTKRDALAESAKFSARPLLEVELILYEPLCTPFAEIYFITYGKKYPTRSCYKLSVPRKMLIDAESLAMLRFVDQNVTTFKHLRSGAIVSGHDANIDSGALNMVRNVTGSFSSKNYDGIISFRPALKNRVDESDIGNALGFRDNLSLLNFIRLSFDANIGSNPNTSTEHIFIIFKSNEKIFCHSILKNTSEVVTFELCKLAEYLDRHTNFQSYENHLANSALYSDALDVRLNSLSSRLSSLLQLSLSRNNDLCQKEYVTPRTNDRFSNVPEIFSNASRIFDATLLQPGSRNSVFLIDRTQLPPFLSSHLSMIKNQPEYYTADLDFNKKGKYLPKIRSANVMNANTHKNLKTCDNSFKFRSNITEHYYDFSSASRSTSKVRSHSLVKRKLKDHATFPKTRRISRNIYRSNSPFRTRKSGSCFRENSKISKGRNSTWKKLEFHPQTTRNRNYGRIIIRREIEGEIAVVKETASESAFSIESPPAATSPTGFAAECLFPPPSVRESAEARLSSSSPIQPIRSVPAVQRPPPPLVDRESRFAGTKDRKHEFRNAAAMASVAAASGVTDSQNPADSCLDPDVVFNSSDTERITTAQDHDFKDYDACYGSAQKGLQRLICDRACDLDYCHQHHRLPSDSCQNMATSEENPRLMNKVTRTPGRNISKLKKLFDHRENGSSGPDESFSKNDESDSLPSQSTVVNISVNSQQQHAENKSETAHDEFDECDNSLNENHSDSSNLNIRENASNKSQQKVSSDIPYCRKVPSGGDLWKNVDIGVTNEGLWAATQNNFDLENSIQHTDSRQVSNSFVSSTADLHDLIAASKAKLSNKDEPVLSEKSTLESYFTSFENSKPKKFVPLNSTNQSFPSSSSSFGDSVDFQISSDEIFKTSVTYDCDIDEMNFDEEDAVLSDTSSDEEFRCNAPMNNTHYLPAYAPLPTINEESCEESSRNPTPTNEPVASNLERYFSWDIINDVQTNSKRKGDDNSTIYSDSLSEGSGSLNGEAGKEIDPVQLASSRLEKYFTSGLVGSEKYVYPDDAEFLEDGPVSDFEEDSIHQKISRSALLSSLENVAEQQSIEMPEENNEEPDSSTVNTEQPAFDTVMQTDSDRKISETSAEIEEVAHEDSKSDTVVQECDISDECVVGDTVPSAQDTSILLMPNSSTENVSCDLQEPESEKIEPVLIESSVDENDTLAQKQTVNKEQLAIDVQAIIKKLLMYFSGTGSNSFKHNRESDYISAWQILETEIERLIQSISPTALMENHSCNSSSIDSNNSDYGSDTIESLECITDEDESADTKNRGTAKYPMVDLFTVPGPEFRSFNISDETLSIWKRLIQSLQKDSFCMNDKLYDPNTEARLYIRDQIVNLMHTVTVNESKVDKIDATVLGVPDKEMEVSLVEESNESDDINEAFNVSVSGTGLLTYSKEEGFLTAVSKIESVANEPPEISEAPVTSPEDYTDDKSEYSCEPAADFENHPPPKKSLLENSTSSDESVLPNTQPEKISVDEVDLKLNTNRMKSGDNTFSVCVDIDLSEEAPAGPTPNRETALTSECPEETVKRTSLHLWVSGDAEKDEKPSASDNPPKKDNSLYVDEDSILLPDPDEIFNSVSALNGSSRPTDKSHRDTGYYSFKSSDDCILHDTPPPDEFTDVPNFKSLKRSVKKFPLSNTLSKSTTNINQVLSDAKFSTLQLKNRKSKGSIGSPSRQFTSLFSPTAVFKKLTGSKGNDSATPESSIPPKYLKKYARSASVESETMVGAISMPQLNFPKPGDSYSALGLYSENDRDSSLIADDETEVKRFPPYSQSVLSLGAHSASMTSVYSAATCHYGYVTVSGDVLFGLNYNHKSQMMEVFVKQCRNLAAVDARRNKSDPYVKVYLLPDKTKGGKRKTKTKKNTLSPVFNELLKFPVPKNELESRTLWLSVWNSDLFGRNDFLGEVTLPLGYRLLDSPTLRWYPLQERMESLTSPLNYRGELFLALKYVPRDLSLESRFRPAPVISLRGALHVLVKEARNISANGSGGNLDAFCKSYLLPDQCKSTKQKTPVVKKSRHPKWYYTMIYEDLSVDELKERSLELTVWDHDKLTSNEFMGGIRLNLGTGLYHGLSAEWMDARRDEAALWQAMLQSPNMWVDGCLPLRPTMQFHHGAN